MKYCIISFLSLFLSCNTPKTEVDLIVTNAKVYTVNSNFDTVEAFAVNQGKFVAVGTTSDILNTYKSAQIIDANQQAITPGFIDAYCHFYGLGLNQQSVNLVGTTSYTDVIIRVVEFQKNANLSYITGRGWDQNDWNAAEFPNKDTLDLLFPDTPVALTRIDGHAMLCNSAALKLAGITEATQVEGGEVIVENGQLTGVLIDNPMALVEGSFPEPTKAQKIQALQHAETLCFQYGLTTVSDAGLDKSTIYLIDSLQQANALKMRVYAMLSNTEENLSHFLAKGKIKTDRLNVQSVKVYADGALGSRGAALKAPYSDKHNHFGAMVIGNQEFQNLANRLAQSDYQMNTHAIGDSANRVVLKTYDKLLLQNGDRRWRVEHAQVITDEDINYFKNENIIPSVQPTHATSDMYWADHRLGNERLKGAYAYNDLLKMSGQVALGTDFPVEEVNPFLTFYAAAVRKDTKGFPEGGFQSENALSRENTLRGMTIWAAHSNFEEHEKGSIEVGKFADFIILDQDIMTIDETLIPTTKIRDTYSNGEKVY